MYTDGCFGAREIGMINELLKGGEKKDGYEIS